MFRRGGRQSRRQAGGGGFTPNKLSGCVLWLRADLGITLNAGNVSAWADQSGNGNNFTQGTGANQPGYATTGNNRGTGPALTFANASSQFLSRSSAVLGNATLSLFLTLKCTNTANPCGVVSIGTTGAANAGWDASIDLASTSAREITTEGVLNQTDGAASTSWEEWTITRDATTWALSVNQVSQTLSANTSNPGAQAAFAGIGCRSGGGTGFYSGSIDEIIGYSRLLSATERATVEAYIRARTAIW